MTGLFLYLSLLLFYSHLAGVYLGTGSYSENGQKHEWSHSVIPPEDLKMRPEDDRRQDFVPVVLGKGAR